MYTLKHLLLGTDVQASTIHALLELDYDLKSKLDLAMNVLCKVPLMIIWLV